MYLSTQVSKYVNRTKFYILLVLNVICMYLLGVKVRNMKMDFNTEGTWRRAMNTNDDFFFILAKSLSSNK